MVGYLLLAVYCICILFTTFYCIMQLDLLFWYRKPKKETLPILATYPTVTIQLPLFNEAYVSERLIDNIVKLDYPADKLEIQVLDDSNDETVGIVAAKVAEYQAKGVNIVHVRRPDRSGFKAGALRDGLKMTDSEFVAIFDADFLPKTDFLKHPAFFQRRKNWRRSNPLGTLERRLFVDYKIASDAVERAFYGRASGSSTRRILVAIQRHCGRLAS
jgi:cellulose synthase/poly-beta-1,6-N-acetylglucosamine synthase-like glycosyltransferase